MELDTPINPMKESIKLAKNSKGYVWEIKTHINEELSEPDKMAIERLKKLDDAMLERFGSEVP